MKCQEKRDEKKMTMKYNEWGWFVSKKILEEEVKTVTPK